MLYMNLRAMPPNSRHAQPTARLSNQKGFMRLAMMLVVAGGLVWGALAVSTQAKVQADAPSPEIKSAAGDYCLDDYHNQANYGASVVAWDCNGSSAQNWQIDGSLIKKSAQYCLAVIGSRVVLNGCNSNDNNQAWAQDGVGLENLGNNQCLTLPNGKTGVQLTTSNCANLTSINESWTPSEWPGAPLASLSSPLCHQPQVGDRVACYAERQWLAWQTEPTLHLSLLYDYTGGNPYEEWCADFVSYIYLEAGAPFSSGERGVSGWDEYDANNVINAGLNYHSVDSGYLPKPGDIAYFNYSGGHVEIVLSGGKHPVFIYGDSGTIDPGSGNGDMAENQIVNDGSQGSLVYYLSPE